jgi:hypothetical protein
MQHNKSTYRLFLFLTVMLPNIIALASRLWIDLDRSLFVYEYLLVFLLMAFNIRSFFSWALFVFVFLLDLATIFSKIYLFNLPEFLNSLQYFINYAINIYQMGFILITLTSLIGIYFLFKLIKKKIGNDKSLIQLFLFMFVFVFILDNINGSSFFMVYQYNGKLYKGNLGGFPTQVLYRQISSKNNLINKIPILNPLQKESITFKQFVMDTTSNQMLIIVESMGLIDDSIKREAFQNSISDIFKQKNWETSWGQTYFTGGTTTAELRELLNCDGSYQYFISQKNSKNFSSIFQIKKKKGYHVNAIHSYKGDMFERRIWWKNIGVDEIYFREDLVTFYKFKLNLNHDTPFISLNDEDAFDFIQAKTANRGKQFSYFLTENGHLPIITTIENQNSSLLFDIDKESVLSKHGRNHLKRISNFLIYIASHLDSIKFQSIVIVGDHAPPFLKKEDRSFYNNKFVPYLIVTK